MTDLDIRRMLLNDLKHHLSRIDSNRNLLIREIKFRDNLPQSIFHDEFQLTYHRSIMVYLRNIEYDLMYCQNLIDELIPFI